MKINRFLIWFLLCFSVTTLFLSCQKEYSLEIGQITSATGSLKDSTTGNCFASTVNGTYYNGVAPGDTNYVEITVNVTSPGTYFIATNTQNGFSFSDSGFFDKTGYGTVRLKAISTPTLPVTTDFTVSFDTSVCSFSVNVKDSTGTGLGGGNTGGGEDTTQISDSAWRFSEGSNFYSGGIDSGYKDNSSGAATFTYIYGTTSTGDTTFSLTILGVGTDITTGTYKSSSGGAIFTFNDAANFNTLYQADAFTAGTDLTVIITSYDTTTTIVEGTFSGTVRNSSGGFVTITNGKFKATVT